MQRDADLVREILKTIEAKEDFACSYGDLMKLGKPPIIVGHLQIMRDAGFVEPVLSPSGTTMAWRISWEGHEFLDKVRDPAIWKATKEGAAKVGGFSLKLLGELATGYVKAEAMKLGLPIG